MLVKAILSGQAVALCLGGVGIFSKMLISNDYYSAFVQVTVGYLLMSSVLFVVRPWKSGLKVEAWRYALLATIDATGNLCYSKAFGDIAASSVRMTIGFTVPGSVILGYFVFNRKVSPRQIVAVLIAVSGVVLNFTGDAVSDRKYRREWPENGVVWKGFLYALIAATCFAISNVFEEWVQRKAHEKQKIDDRYTHLEMVGMMGLLGALITPLLGAALEWNTTLSNGTIFSKPELKLICYGLGFAICMCSFYVGLSIFLTKHNASFLNLNMLTVSIDVLIFEALYTGGFRANDWVYMLAFFLSLAGTGYFYFAGYQAEKKVLETSKDGIRV